MHLKSIKIDLFRIGCIGLMIYTAMVLHTMMKYQRPCKVEESHKGVEVKSILLKATPQPKLPKKTPKNPKKLVLIA